MYMEMELQSIAFLVVASVMVVEVVLMLMRMRYISHFSFRIEWIPGETSIISIRIYSLCCYICDSGDGHCIGIGGHC